MRLGRAMLRPLFEHSRNRHGRMGQRLMMCLQWWIEILQLHICQSVPWQPRQSPIVHLFADARGAPARLAAVLFCGGRTWYTDFAPPAELLSIFTARQDSQIMGLELLAIALGISTFAEQCRGRRVHVWSDNTGSESCLRKGAAKAFDHMCLTHCIWARAAQLQLHMKVDRVPSDENIADLPSRESYDLLRSRGASYVQPHLDGLFWQPQSWESLSLRFLL